MSIEKMSLVNIVGELCDLDQTLESCCRAACFHPEISAQFANDIQGITVFQEINPYKPLVKRLADLAANLKFKLYFEDYGKQSRSIEEMTREITRLEDQFIELSNEKANLSQLITQNEQTLIQLKHLLGLHAKFDDIFSCAAVSSRFGLLPNDSFEKLSYYADKPFFFFTFDTDAQYHWGFYFAPTVMKREIDDIFNSLYFERIWIPDYAHQTPDIAISNISKMLEDYKAEFAAAEKKLVQFTQESQKYIRQLFSEAQTHSETFELRKYVVAKNDQFFLVGFVPEREAKKFAKLFEGISSADCVIRSCDADPRLTPPVKLKNNWFTRPFEMFVKMYGLPSYGKFDPTPLVAITYCILFGIMFGDLGQGLLIALIGIIAWKWKKIELGRILSRIGIFSALFGVVYGSVFGLEHVLDPFYIHVLGLPSKPVEVFNPQTTNTLLLISVGIGVFLIILSIVINIILGLRSRNIEGAVFGNNGFAGLVFYVSVIAAVALLMIFNINVLNPWFIIFCIVIPLLLIFLREPLAKLVTKQKNIKPSDGIGGFIIENFFELFENVLSYITNTVSFVRVGGFILSHAGMMAVVLTLMEMLGGIASPIVFVIGNLFVMGMEGLIVGIQVLRLEFYEIFSRFYEGDGKNFQPASISYDIKE